MNRIPPLKYQSTQAARLWRQGQVDGFSLIEILVVLAILSVFSGLAIDSGLQSLQRDRVNSVVVALAGWLETVRASAATGNKCEVLISTGLKRSGDTLASLNTATSSSGCQSDPLNMPLDSSNRAYTLASNATTLIYTKRGTLATQGSSDIVISVTPSDGGNARCINIAGLPGFISIGKYSGGTCQKDGVF
jgi:prepilin-type N-terminal cleavage/methylation domain-containing protein